MANSQKLIVQNPRTQFYRLLRFWIIVATPSTIAAFFPSAPDVGILVFYTLPLGICCLIITFYKIIVALWKAHWHSALAISAVPSLILIAYLLFFKFFHIPMRVYILVHEKDFMEKISTIPSEQPKVKWFEIGHWGWVGTGGENYIIYDEIGEIEHLPPWRKNCVAFFKIQNNFYYASQNDNACDWPEN